VRKCSAGHYVCPSAVSLAEINEMSKIVAEVKRNKFFPRSNLELYHAKSVTGEGNFAIARAIVRIESIYKT